MIKGVSKDEPLETNAQGGIQSASPYGVHLMSSFFIDAFYNDGTFNLFYKYLICKNDLLLFDIIHALQLEYNLSKEDTILMISEVRKEACKKYPINNWKQIPCEEHINHAMVHYLALRAQDSQDDHLGHCLCRLMFAIDTDFSASFLDEEKK